jgi:hypothetical protein
MKAARCVNTSALRDPITGVCGRRALRRLRWNLNFTNFRHYVKLAQAQGGSRVLRNRDGARFLLRGKHSWGDARNLAVKCP